jgi:hypothetical protein
MVPLWFTVALLVVLTAAGFASGWSCARSRNHGNEIKAWDRGWEARRRSERGEAREG